MFKNVDLRCWAALDLIVTIELVVHHTDKACQGSLSVSNAEVKKGLDLLRELRKFHENVLLLSHLQESRQIYAGMQEVGRIGIIADRKVQLVYCWYSVALAKITTMQVTLTSTSERMLRRYLWLNELNLKA